MREGKRGGVCLIMEEEEEADGCLGSSGRVVEGAGFGEGNARSESRDIRTRRGVG